MTSQRVFGFEVGAALLAVPLALGSLTYAAPSGAAAIASATASLEITVDECRAGGTSVTCTDVVGIFSESALFDEFADFDGDGTASTAVSLFPDPGGPFGAGTVTANEAGADAAAVLSGLGEAFAETDAFVDVFNFSAGTVEVDVTIGYAGSASASAGPGPLDLAFAAAFVAVDCDGASCASPTLVEEFAIAASDFGPPSEVFGDTSLFTFTIAPGAFVTLFGFADADAFALALSVPAPATLGLVLVALAGLSTTARRRT